MKVACFTNILPPYRIGLYNKLSSLLNGNITFYFDSAKNKQRKWVIKDDLIKFKYIFKNSFGISLNSKISNGTKLHRIIYFPFYIFPECLKERPDVIITSEMGLRTLFCLISGKLIGAKTYLLSEVTNSSELNISFIRKAARKIICLLINGGIAHGKASKDYLLKLGLKESKITISPDSVDNDFFISESMKYSKNQLRKKLNISQDTFVFLYVGQFIHRKGMDLLLNAFEEFIKNSPEKVALYLVGGEQEQLCTFKNKIDENAIKVVGFKQEKELIPYLRMSDCFIFPTRSDIWGLVINEAIACGLPVTTSKYAECYEDLIENEINGYVFDPLDHQSFVKTIEKCVKGKEKLETFAEKAKDKLKIYNHDVAAERIVEFILNKTYTG